VAASLNALAQLAIEQSRFDEAQRLLERADALVADELPETSPQRMSIRHNLSAVYARRGLWDRAEPMQREILEQRRAIYGPDSDITARSLESLAVTLANLGRHRESAEAFAEALAIFERTLDPNHWRIANESRNVGQLLALQGRYEEGLPYLDRSIEIGESGDGEPGAMAYQRGQRALIWLGMGQLERAREELAWVAEQIADPDRGNSPAYQADSQVWLGMAELRAGHPEPAQECFELALAIRFRVLGVQHPKYAEAACGVGITSTEPIDPALAEMARRYRAWGLAHPLMLELIEEHTN